MEVALLFVVVVLALVVGAYWHEWREANRELKRLRDDAQVYMDTFGEYPDVDELRGN